MEPDSRIWANPDLLKLWLWCLAKATYLDDKWVSIKSGKGFIDIEIKRGQFLYGRHSAANELNINPSTMRERISKLQKLGFIDIKSDKQYSIITICNYDYYQTRDNEKGQPQGQQTHQPTLTPNDTKKKVKKDKKENKKETTTAGNGKPSTATGKEKINFDYEKRKFEYITDVHRTQWEQAYPAVDVLSELRRAEVWSAANPKNRKSNWERFITNWFTRAQDRAKRQGGGSPPPKKEYF